MHEMIPHREERREKLKKIGLGALTIAVLMFCLGWYYHSSVFEKLSLEAQKIAEKLRPYTTEEFRALTWKKVETPTPWENRDSAEVYEWQGSLYLFGGLNGNGTLDANGMPQYDKAKYFNDIWKSEDGLQWERVVEQSDLPPMRAMSIIPFKGSLYLLNGWMPDGGHNPSIWKSQDAVHWQKVVTKVPFPVREGQRILEHEGKLYMFAGIDYDIHTPYNDVWVSEDAITWKPLTRNAAWEGRWDDDVAFYNNNFWLIGGMSSGAVGYDDIWKSPNGITWTKASSTTMFGKRQGQVVLTYRGALWLVGGLDTKSNNGEGDTWFSTDGDHWEKITQENMWTGREDHRVIVFKGKMILLTGMDTNWNWTNDIWYAELRR